MSPYSYLIKNARIVDGTGSPWYLADVAIKGDRIASIGKISSNQAEQVIDAEGRFLTPGFIDAHIHTDLHLLEKPDCPSSIFQGVTGHVIGQDGISYAPASVQWQKHLFQYFAGVNGSPRLPEKWESVAEYLAHFDDRTAINVAYLLPQGTIRLAVMGLDSREPNQEEIKAMQELAAQGMKEGAVGISTGLDYIPCNYSGTEEIGAVCKPVGEAGGVYVSHIRSYSKFLDEAVKEVMEISRIGGLPGHISHYNGPVSRLAPLIDQARASGCDLTFDTYPFLAGCTILSMVALTRKMEEGGITATIERLKKAETREELSRTYNSENNPLVHFQLMYIEHDADRELEGLMIPEAAKQRNQAEADFVCDLLIRSEMKVSVIAHHSGRTMEDVIGLMKHPAHVGGSDGIYKGSVSHPRGYATFSRYLELVRDEQVMSLETMVVHLASHPARRFHFYQRGLIVPGYFADFNLFDLKAIKSTVEYGKPPKLAEGMDYVFVNGQPVLLNRKPTGIRSGKAMRGPGTS